MSVHMFSEDESTAELADRYGDWLVLQGFKDQPSADELLMFGTLTSDQRDWLERFDAAWQAAQNREDGE